MENKKCTGCQAVKPDWKVGKGNSVLKRLFGDFHDYQNNP